VGVVPNFHPPATEQIDKTGPMTVMWVANLKPWKQPEVFIRLAASLRDIPGVRFVIVGAPPGRYLGDWYENLRRSGNAAGNVEFLGELPQPQVNALLARAQVLVNTSLHEGFPNTFIQAWMRDAAVVSLHVDPDDVLDRERVGIHAVSEEGLAQAVRMLLTDPQQRAALVARARRHALERHSMRNALWLAQLIDTGEIRFHADAAVNQ
jgi:glycosyltransferase involved in cell wall biosynthesis